MPAWPARALQQWLRVAVSLSLGGASAHPEKGVVMRATLGRHCRYWAIGGLAAVVGLAGVASPARPAPAGNRQDLEDLHPLVGVMMEDTGDTTLIGEPEPPGINPAAHNAAF